ncbi:MAG: LysM peptidoglycan-binding domain-containing protein [Polyangiaceae bacterium]|nr:LysM peptidoglycan-binding domain-containing protein [Polyangiaceae bacterium]
MTMKKTSMALVAALSLVTVEADAFPYVVQNGDTLASVAERFYGKIQYERLLVAANDLDAEGGTPIVPGMRLEVPAVGHHRVRAGETWAGLATELLGDARRADKLATANGSHAWIPPEEGAQIVIPFHLRIVVRGSENTPTLAYRFLGNMTKAWELDHYNNFGGRTLQRGDVVLIPLTNLELTPEGRTYAAVAAEAQCSQASGAERTIQRRVQAEIPALIADVRSGRYVDAVRRGNAFLNAGQLPNPTLATVYRQLLEAYVALDALGLAAAACTDWQKHDPEAHLEPVRVSPKIIAACERGAARSAP